MAIVTNFDALKWPHDEARRCGANSRAWIEFAATMMDSFPRLYQTAQAMNARQAALEAALRNLVAQVELHTDCMDGRIDASALDAQIDAAERLVGTWPEFSPFRVSRNPMIEAQPGNVEFGWGFGGSWIDASKELPDAETTVLVCIKGADEPVWLGYYNGEEWKDVEGMGIDVTHWADIPLPPGDEEEVF